MRDSRYKYRACNLLGFPVPEFPAMATFGLSASIIFFANMKIPHSRMTTRPLAAMNQEHGMRVPYELKMGQSRIFHKLPSGLNVEVIFQERVKHRNSNDGKDKSQNPPLVFIHGSFHAAWCWAEHWLPYFSQNGYDCYAVSLLGQVYLCSKLLTLLHS